MAIQANISAVEESTFVVTLSFQDEDGNSVTPNTIQWTLTDVNGNVINNRQNVSISPSDSVSIVLSGDDLALQSGETNVGKRVLTIYATYDSSRGNNLPLKEEVFFDVIDLTIV